MHAVDTVDVVRVAFALWILLAAGTLACAWLDRLTRRQIVWLAAIAGAGAVGAWILFALNLDTAIAVAAAGMTVAALATAAALGVHRGVVHAHGIEAELKQAEARLNAVVEQGTQERATELEQILSRARAEALSLLGEEERRIAEERRVLIAERERSAAIELSDALNEVQRRVEQRLAEWGEDLERAQATLFDQLQRLAAQQRRLIEEAENRVARAAERLESESEVQRAALVKLRQELEQSTTQAIARSSADFDAHALERRQALNELAERLHRRERELREELDREQSEAIQGIQSTFTDVERRLVERLERVVDRTTAQHVDQASLQFMDAIKHSREESAKRLSRELERAVETFTHEAESLISERIENLGQTAAQRLDRRLVDADSTIATRRDEVVAAVEQRLAAAERELRQRLDELSADADAQRAILDARLFELQRRIDTALSQVKALEA
jgi:hypothetical protein